MMHDVSQPLDANSQNPFPVENPWWVKTAAISTAVIGLVVLCGWAFGIEALKRLLPGLVTMKANTAAAFVLSGICLYLQTLPAYPPFLLLVRRSAAALVFLLGLATLGEYQFGWDAGIDQLLFSEPAGATLTSHPGRMSNITALNFALAGGALLLIEARLWIAAQAATSVMAAAALMSLGGYMFGNLLFLRVGTATSIAAHTVTAFLILSTGIMAATRDHGFMVWLRNRLRAIGMAASLIMLIFTFGAASYNFVQKDKASEWVEHTYKVIHSIELFSDSMHDFMYHNRGFLITGDDLKLVERNKRRETMLVVYARMRHLTTDNPAQQERLETLNRLVQKHIEQADLVTRMRREKGFETAAAMETRDMGAKPLDEIEAKLEELKNTELDLLGERQRVAEVIRASSLFSLGILLTASMLLLLWAFRASQREIAERMHAEEKLRLASLYARSLIEASLDPLVTISPEGKITDANRATEEATGIPRNQLIGTDFSGYFTEPEQAQAGYRQVFDHGFVRDYPLTIRHRSGSLIDVLYNATVYRDVTGSVQGVFAAARDITERKRMEGEIAQREALFRNYFELGQIGMAITSLEHGWLRVNNRLCEMLGYAREELNKMTWSELTYPDDLEPDLVQFRKLISGEIKSYTIDKRFIRKGGSLVYTYLAVSCQRKPDGSPDYFIASLQDITERKQAEDELARERLFLAVLLDNIAEAVVSCDAQGVLTRFNQSARELHGLPEQHIPPELWGDYYALYQADGKTPLRKEAIPLFRALQGERVRNAEMAVVQKGGTARFLIASGQPMRDSGGKLLGAVVTMHDITERKLAEKVLRQSEVELKESQRIAHLANWYLDVATNQVVWSDELYRMYGFDPALPPPPYTEHHKLFTPDSWEKLSVALANTKTTGIPYELELNTVRIDGSNGWMWVRGERLCDENNAVVGLRGVAQDITERKLAENELREKEERLALATIQNGVGVWDWNLITQEMIWDDSMYSLYRIRREDFIGTEEAWRKALHPDDLHRGDQEVSDAIAGIKPFNTDFRVVWPNGEVRHIKAVAKVFRDERGTPLRMLGINMDITERKQAEEALRASEERLHSIIQTSMDGIVQMDADGIVTGWNSQMERVFGWPIAEAIGRALHETIIPPQHREAHVNGLKHFLLTGEGPVLNKRVEVMGLHRDGHVFPVELTVTPIKMRGQYEFSAFLRDISERKRQENIQAARLRLMESAARFSLKELLVATLDEACTLAGSPIGFYHFLEADQKTLTLQAWSTRTAREFCKAEGEGRHYDIGEAGVWVDCVRERRPVIHNDYAALPHKRGLPPGHAHVEREMVVPIFRNELIVAILGVGNKATPYDDNDLESVIRLADVAWDIAEARRADEEIRKLNAELEQRVVERTAKLEAANKDMESFSYSISHDLRAPLRAINGFSKILQEDYIDRLDDEGRRLLNVVSGNAQKMGELIDDILAFSRAGRNEVVRTKINMKNMVAGIWEELKPDMTGRDVHLELRDMPPIEGDAAMMHQVVFNLLSNAVKFTQHRADARIEVGGQAGEHETVYYVRDNGAGFDMQYADKLFGVFQRLHGIDEFEGTGIGLAIVKRIVTKHGGHVWAEGKLNEGATIYFALPAKKDKGNLNSV